MVKIFLLNPAETIEFGKYLSTLVIPGDVILLSGDLGSGKTTLVQGIAQGLEIEETVLSPTFSLINEYPEGKIPLYHLDLYRLSPPEVISLEVENYWEGIEVTPGVTVIEWGQHLVYLPEQYLAITLKDVAQGREADLVTTGEIQFKLRFSCCGYTAYKQQKIDQLE